MKRLLEMTYRVECCRACQSPLDGGKCPQCNRFCVGLADVPAEPVAPTTDWLMIAGYAILTCLAIGAAYGFVLLVTK